MAKWGPWLSRLYFVVVPLVSYHLVEILNYNDPWGGLTLLQIALNLIWYYMTEFFLWLILGRSKRAAGTTLVLFGALGIINRYAIRFRGRTVFPGDLRTLRTALNVSGGYDFMPDRTQVFCVVVMVVLLVLLYFLPPQPKRRLPPGVVWMPVTAACLCYIFLFFHTSFLSRLNIEPSMWTTRGNGFLLNYTVCLRYSHPEAPPGYDPDQLAKLAEQMPSDKVAAKPFNLSASRRPVNLIVVMNESFADFGYIEDMETNEDFLPFYHSLTENTIKGTAYSSVFGGTTANSEFEFLTGHTTAFLPPSTVPYQLYVEEGTPSLVSQLNMLGYESIALHPYYSSGWNRVEVYHDFGFNKALFLEDFQDLTYIRNFASDRSDYENLVRLYEEKPAGQRLFLFNVTMQNHGSYNLPWTGLERTVWLTGKWEHRFSTVDQYLSLIRESDRALEYLIGYFSQVDEPTMILIFGDHQPQVATNFYTEALGGEFDELDVETAQKRQEVPFLLWANYDIPEQTGLRLSLNYLAALLVEQANLPQTGYQRFLSSLRRELPVINTVGYLDKSGNFTCREEDLSEGNRRALAAYEQLQYNALFDGKNRLDDFFFLREG